MMFEPLGGSRYTSVGESHTRKDFARRLKDLSDIYYPNAEKIILVMDNLATHTLASLYLEFPPQEARRIAARFEIHYTPKHGSWLDMAEIEIGVMNRQCLNRRIPDMASITHEISCWQCQRNNLKRKANWQFTTKDARIKLQHLYPKF
jgi:hypothetical protein